MARGLRTLAQLIEDPGPCPVCDEHDCEHRFYGEEHYRIGDPMTKHPLVGRRFIPAPRRLYRPNGALDFGEGQLMTVEEAMRHGVPVPADAAPPRKKGRRRSASSTPAP